MDLSLLSVWEDIKSFLAGNLQLVILVAGAVLAVAAIIIIAACVTAIKRRRAADGRDTAAREGAACDREELPAEEQPGGAEEGSVPVAEAQPAVADVQPAVAEAQTAVAEAQTAVADVQTAVAEAQPDIPQETDVPAAEEPARQEYPVQGKVMFIKPRPGMFIRYRYNRSFAAKLIQSEDKVKRWYSELKRELLSYKKVSARVSWRHESFRYGRPTAAKFVIRGKTLCLCLALDPAAYAESKYIVSDMSRYSKFAATPLLYRIKNERRCRYAKELIAKLFEGAEAAVPPEEDFSAIPYEDTQSLVEKGLIRIVSYEEVSVAEGAAEEEYEDDDDFGGEDFDDDDEDELEEVSAADAGALMADDRAKLRVQQGEAFSDKAKSAVVNIDTLGQFFEEGERVTLDEVKRRVPFIAKNVTYIKVLARGTLNKPLIVVADDFSLEAVKMIVLTGGRAIKNRRKN